MQAIQFTPKINLTIVQVLVKCFWGIYMLKKVFKQTHFLFHKFSLKMFPSFHVRSFRIKDQSYFVIISQIEKTLSPLREWIGCDWEKLNLTPSF